ncbi:MAG: response regulator [Planctomycetota bacterium]|jgi:DNA-binding response OmpR family regulator
MAESARLLIADDENTFLQATGDLLRREGYQCDCVSDATSAVDKLKENRYDLLIADIKMPGNPDLELVRDLPSIAQGLSVILVTAYPSRDSAIKAVGLPVVSYLVKPVDFDELLRQVHKAVEKNKLYKAVINARQRLEYWQEGLSGLEEAIKSTSGEGFSASAKSFMDLTYGNVAGALTDIKNITVDKLEENVNTPVCNLLNCPRLGELKKGVEETIRVLEKSKGAFKSRELGILRKNLEKLLNKD